MLTGRRHRGAAARDLHVHGFHDREKESVHGIDEKGRESDLRYGIAFSQRVIGELLVRRRFHYTDQVPVSVEFVGQHHRQRRVHALAHVRVRNDGGHRVVGRDLDPDVEHRLVPGRNQAGDLGSAISRPYCDAEDDRAAGQHARGNKRPPRPLIHWSSPPRRRA